MLMCVGTGRFGKSENLVRIFSADVVEEEDQTGDMAMASALKCLQVFPFPSILIKVARGNAR